MLVSYVLMEVFAWFFLGNLRAFERNRAREKIFEKAVSFCFGSSTNSATDRS